MLLVRWRWLLFRLDGKSLEIWGGSGGFDSVYGTKYVRLFFLYFYSREIKNFEIRTFAMVLRGGQGKADWIMEDT